MAEGESKVQGVLGADAVVGEGHQEAGAVGPDGYYPFD